MAITITSSPNSISPVYNSLTYIVSSDQTGQPNFKFVFNITVGSQTITIKQNPRPDGYGVLDVHRVLENFVSSDFDPATTTFALNSNSWVNASIECAEEYGTPPTKPVSGSQTTSLSPFNACLETNYQWSQWMANLADYVIGFTGKQQFLTNAPRTQYIARGQKSYLHFINYSVAISGKVPGYELLIKIYNSSNTHLSTQSLQTTFDTVSTANTFQRVPVGADLVESFFAIPDGGYYTLQLISKSGSVTSELFTFILDDLCTVYNTYRFHFLNQLGGFDSFNFKCKDTITTDIVPTTYQRTPGVFNSSGFIYKNTDRGVVTSNIAYTDKITVESDWVTDAEALWLKELITSPVVFWEDGQGNFTPVTISSNSYETKKSNRNEKLHNISIQFTLLEQSRQRF